MNALIEICAQTKWPHGKSLSDTEYTLTCANEESCIQWLIVTYILFSTTECFIKNPFLDYVSSQIQAES